MMTMLITLQYLFYPETKGLALEDVDKIFDKSGFVEHRSLYVDADVKDTEMSVQRVEGKTG